MKGEKNMYKLDYSEIATLGTLFFKNDDDETRLYYLSGQSGEDKFTVTKIGIENIPENSEGFPIFSLDNFCRYSGYYVKIIE